MSARLPETRDTLVAALASDEEADRGRALDLICRVYRAPVAALLALRWHLEPEDAEDLTQDFLASAVEKGWFRRYDPVRGRFRPFLRGCLDEFVRSARRDARRLKRGGAVEHLSLDEVEPLLGAPDEIERHFEREWARSVLAIAVERLREECLTEGKDVAWRLYARYDLTDLPDAERPTYASLAAEYGEPVTQVTNHLAWARRRMREHVLATLRLLTGGEAEYRDEVRALTGEAP